MGLSDGCLFRSKGLVAFKAYWCKSRNSARYRNEKSELARFMGPEKHRISQPSWLCELLQCIFQLHGLCFTSSCAYLFADTHFEMNLRNGLKTPDIVHVRLWHKWTACLTYRYISCALIWAISCILILKWQKILWRSFQPLSIACEIGDRRADNINSTHLYVKRSLGEIESQRLHLKLRIVLLLSS